MLNTGTAFFSALGVIALGYILRRAGLVTRDTGSAIARLVLNVTLPALVLQTVPQIEFTETLLFIPVLSLLHTVAAFAITQLVFRKQPSRTKGLILIASMGFNNGLFAFPIVLELWGIEAIKLLALFDIGNGIVVLGSNYVIAAHYGSDAPMRWRTILTSIMRTLATSVPLIALVIALVVNVTNTTYPAVIQRLVETVAGANSFLALLVLGIFQSFRVRPGDGALLAKVLGLRYTVGILTSLVVFFALPGVRVQQQVLAIAFILPVGMTIIPYAVRFKLDTTLATSVVNLSIIISFFMMWITVQLL